MWSKIKMIYFPPRFRRKRHDFMQVCVWILILIVLSTIQGRVWWSTYLRIFAAILLAFWATHTSPLPTFYHPSDMIPQVSTVPA